MLRSPRSAKAGTATALVLAVATAVACNGEAQSQRTPTPQLAINQSLTYPISGDVATLDPAVVDTKDEAAVTQNVFDGLVRYNDSMQVVPDIAATPPTVSADGLTYTFKLRTEARFSNGDRVTARDVLYSWNRAAALQGSNAPNLSAIAGYATVSTNQLYGPPLEALLEKQDPSVSMSGLKAVGDATVVVTLSSPAGWFLDAIAEPGAVGMVVDQNAVRKDFSNWWSSPATLVGTGPYRMTSLQPGAGMDFTAVPGWWGSPRPALTSVHLKVEPDAANAFARFGRGEFDLFGYGGYAPQVSDVLSMQASAKPSGRVELAGGAASNWVSFNLVSDASRAGGPFTLDHGAAAHDLRLAFALAVDKAALAKQVCQDLACAPATGGLIPKGLSGYLGDRADPLSGFDPVRARALLHSADPDGSKTRGLFYTYDPENPLNDPTARFLQSQWQANLGVSVTIQPVNRTAFIRERLKGGYVLSRDGWMAGYNDPQNWFDNLWGKAAGCPDATCTTGYDTAAYDSLLARADGQPPARGAADYAALARQLISDVAYIPLYYTQGVMLVKPYVKGAGGNNLFDYPWGEITIQSH